MTPVVLASLLMDIRTCKYVSPKLMSLSAIYQILSRQLFLLTFLVLFTVWKKVWTESNYGNWRLFISCSYDDIKQSVSPSTVHLVQCNIRGVSKNLISTGAAHKKLNILQKTQIVGLSHKAEYKGRGPG